MVFLIKTQNNEMRWEEKKDNSVTVNDNSNGVENECRTYKSGTSNVRKKRQRWASNIKRKR